MAIDLGNGKHVLSMKLVDTNTGKERTLFEREGRYCHFVDDIEHEDLIIRLRIDWKDIRNSDPVLDAQIYRRILNQKPKEIPKRSEWHHTIKKCDQGSNMKIYEFEFHEVNLKLRAEARFSISTSIDAILTKEPDC